MQESSLGASRSSAIAGALVGFALMMLSPAAADADTPYVDIGSAGPLEHIYLGNELSCQVKLPGETDLGFYPPDTIPGDCGTFLFNAGNLYSPDFDQHGRTATGGLPSPQPFTPVSQTPVSGSGTAADPFSVTTIVNAGTSGLRISERDRYVVGERFYTSDITISNATGASQTASLYHAGDCYLAGTDNGYGFNDSAAGGIFCSANPNNNPHARIIGFRASGSDSAGFTYVENYYSTVWSLIDGSPFPNTCDCDLDQDNGAGLHWAVTVPAGGQATRSLLTTLDPTGGEPPPAPPAPAVTCKGIKVTGKNVQGTPGDDALVGTPLADQLLGAAGNDSLSGAEDRDCLSGQAGADTISGDDGDDVVRGGGDPDLLLGGADADVISAQNGNDKIKGGSGDDKIKAQGRGSDKVNCGSGNDSAIVDIKDKVSRNCEKVRVVDRH
jgi:Ca2+-binding RTX toxin-like protein